MPCLGNRTRIGIALLRLAPNLSGLPYVLSIAQGGAPSFLRTQCHTSPLGDEPALLFRQRGIKVQHEGVGVGAKLGHDERHALGHQAGDECNVA